MATNDELSPSESEEGKKRYASCGARGLRTESVASSRRASGRSLAACSYFCH